LSRETPKVAKGFKIVWRMLRMMMSGITGLLLCGMVIAAGDVEGENDKEATKDEDGGGG
jgi:hypothetical protein